MSRFSKQDLDLMAPADDLHVSPFREDGETYGTPTWIWSVVVGGELYARAYSGMDSRWFKAAVREKAGRILIARMTKEVAFEHVSLDDQDGIDEAYRRKYSESPYLSPMISARARNATVRIVPRA